MAKKSERKNRSARRVYQLHERQMKERETKIQKDVEDGKKIANWFLAITFCVVAVIIVVGICSR